MEGKGLRIMCLHGKGSTPEKFAERTAFIQELPSVPVRVTTFCPRAPYALNDGGSAWWRTPPGVRSFDATEFEGCEEALAQLEQYWQQNGPFDGIFGFSQGAMLSAIILAKAIRDPQYPIQPKFGVVVGAAYPRPYAEILESVKGGPRTIRSLHVYGTNDDINPPDQAQRVRGCFPDSQAYVHEGGHIVPREFEAQQRYAEFLLSVLHFSQG